MPIPMDAPANFLADLASGKLVRYGAILKDANTGQIVGHLKETGAMESILSSFFSSPLSFLKAANPLGFVADIGSELVTVQQIQAVGKSVEEVRNLVEGLQMATNVAAFGSIAGLGVSVAGFAYTAAKLSSIESKLDTMASDIGLIRTLMTELSINWDAMAEARFLAASEALIIAEKAGTADRQTQLAGEAAAEFKQLRHYYAQLLKRRGILENNETSVDGVWEIMSRYTVACLGLLRAEFIIGDLGVYAGYLESVVQEYQPLVSFSPRTVYLQRCDSLTPLNLDINHQELSESLTALAQTSMENVARIESHQIELSYLLNNELSVGQYLSELRERESDVVLLRH